MFVQYCRAVYKQLLLTYNIVCVTLELYQTTLVSGKFRLKIKKEQHVLAVVAKLVPSYLFKLGGESLKIVELELASSFRSSYGLLTECHLRTARYCRERCKTATDMSACGD